MASLSLCSKVNDTDLVSNDFEEEIHFHTAFSHTLASSSMSSLQSSGPPTMPSNPYDFTPYMDQVISNWHLPVRLPDVI